MKAKYIGECEARKVTVRGVEFPEKKAVVVEDEELFLKLVDNSHFETQPETREQYEAEKAAAEEAAKAAAEAETPAE